MEPELVLLAVGRKPDIDEKIEGITYLGDAYGSIQLAHFAIKQAIAEVTGVEFDENLVPSVVYGCPEIAWIGLREQDLEEGTYKKLTCLFQLLENPIAITALTDLSKFCHVTEKLLAHI